MSEFHFKTKLDQTLLLGIRARTVPELLDGITRAPDSSIYFHTHKFLHQHHYLSPEPPNDFAYWITEVLNDAKLGEALSSVDVIQYHTLANLRKVFIELLSAHATHADRTAHAPQGEEFHFMASRLFVLGTPYVARTLSEFKEMLRLLSINSLYYHIFDARLRLEREENDFSRWFRDQGKPVLADEVARLDPYTSTLEGLRIRIIRLVERYDTN
jgi:hypothetical protein